MKIFNFVVVKVSRLCIKPHFPVMMCDCFIPTIANVCKLSLHFNDKLVKSVWNFWNTLFYIPQPVCCALRIFREPLWLKMNPVLQRVLQQSGGVLKKSLITACVCLIWPGLSSSRWARTVKSWCFGLPKHVRFGITTQVLLNLLISIKSTIKPFWVYIVS